MATEKSIYTYRFLARIIVKTETPIAVGSGDKNMLCDQLVLRDTNNLPYIPGTAIAGVIRHALGEERAKSFFGNQGSENKDNGKGSEIIFSSAYLVDKDKKVVEGLLEKKSDYLQLFENLPIRQHVSIDDKGVNNSRGKFDEEVVYKGTHFCFEIEMVSDGNNQDLFNEVLNRLASSSFRIGSGTRNGFGQIAIVECKKAILNLMEEEDRNLYITKTSSLNDMNFWNSKKVETYAPAFNESVWSEFNVQLKPDDFFLFGSGFGSDDADMTPVTEGRINWDWTKNNGPEFLEKRILIPAASLKGAISHRVAYHYNRLEKKYIKKVGSEYISEGTVGAKNNAVKVLFGYTDKDDETVSQRGNVIISDLFEQEKTAENIKILNHVAIDRFTGGAINGALFTEEVIYGNDETYNFTILVKKEILGAESNIRKAFEATLDDIVTGMLPLGGGVNRGNGCFNGTWE